MVFNADKQDNHKIPAWLSILVGYRANKVYGENENISFSRSYHSFNGTISSIPFIVRH